MPGGSTLSRSHRPPPAWLAALSKLEKPDRRKALRQVFDTLVPYVLLWTLAALTVQARLPYWITLALAVPAGGLLVRTFIIFHDCGHGSFFSSRWANTLLGYLCGVLTFTPFEDWRHEHAVHHATAGDLDHRGEGDVWTLTVDEYRAAPRTLRIGYRLYRNPLVLFVLGPLYLFLIGHRFPHWGASKRARTSVLLTNLGLLAAAMVLSATLGLRTYLLVQLPMIALAAATGTWLFYIQHQYEGVYWDRHQDWDPVAAAMEGSSYYRLPRLLQWFTGNIGLHHIHHLRPRIANYHLQACYDTIPDLQAIEPLTFRKSLKSLGLRLWDETSRKLVGYNVLKTPAPAPPRDQPSLRIQPTESAAG